MVMVNLSIDSHLLYFDTTLVAPTSLTCNIQRHSFPQSNLHKLRVSMRSRLGEQRDCVGSNMAGLRFVRQQIKAKKAAKQFVQ